MNFLNEFDFVTSPYKRYTSEMKRGHYVPLVGIYNSTDGLSEVKSLKEEDRYSPGPLILVTALDFGHYDVKYTITISKAKKKEYETYQDSEGNNISDIVWEADGTATLTQTVPAYTKRGTVYFVTGSKYFYKINSVTIDNQHPTDEVEFYCLASPGAKFLFGLNWSHLYEWAKDILYGQWAAPPQCPLCSGTGTYSGQTCPQCDGYGWNGRQASKWLLLQKAKDLGVSVAGKTKKRIQAEAWSKSWNTIPTETEIKRFFAHFADLEDNEVFFEKVEGGQHPRWEVQIPLIVGLGSQFNTESDQSTWRAMAERITPAGVLSWVNFYDNYWVPDSFLFEDSWFEEFSISTPWPDWWGQPWVHDVDSSWGSGYWFTGTYVSGAEGHYWSYVTGINWEGTGVFREYAFDCPCFSSGYTESGYYYSYHRDMFW